MDNEREKIRILLKCFNAIQHGANEDLSGYDSEWLELKLLHLTQHIKLSMSKVTDLYDLEQIEIEQKKEVRKLEDEIIEENLKRAEKGYDVSWAEVDKRREQAKKKTLETLTKPLSKKAKKKYVGTHTKAGKAPNTAMTSAKKRVKNPAMGKHSLWNRVRHCARKPEEDVTDKEKHEVIAYVETLKVNRKMKVKDALEKIGISHSRYYRWRNLEGLTIKCKECGTGKTPQWRQYQDGIYCNACGIKKYRKGLKKQNRGKK